MLEDGKGGRRQRRAAGIALRDETWPALPGTEGSNILVKELAHETLSAQTQRSGNPETEIGPGWKRYASLSNKDLHDSTVWAFGPCYNIKVSTSKAEDARAIQARACHEHSGGACITALIPQDAPMRRSKSARSAVIIIVSGKIAHRVDGVEEEAADPLALRGRHHEHLRDPPAVAVREEVQPAWRRQWRERCCARGLRRPAGLHTDGRAALKQANTRLENAIDGY